MALSNKFASCWRKEGLELSETGKRKGQKEGSDPRQIGNFKRTDVGVGCHMGKR